MSPAPSPLIILPPVNVTGTPSSTWHAGSDAYPGAAITDLGPIQIWTYSKAHAAQLKDAFAQAERLHDAAERGQQ